MMNTETIVPEIDFEGGSYFKDYNFEEVDVQDKSYNVKLTVNRRNSERYGAKGNVFYIDGTPSPHELSPYHKFYHEELRAGPRGVDLEQDKKWKKYNRLEVKIFDMFINRFMDYLNGMNHHQLYHYILDAGLDYRKWNMHAGCSMCKCSPGFKMKSVSGGVTNHSFSLSFTEIKPQL